MNPYAAWGPTIITTIVMIFTAGLWVAKLRDHDRGIAQNAKRLDAHDGILTEHSVKLARIEGWREGYQTGARNPIPSLQAAADPTPARGCFVFEQSSGRLLSPEGVCLGTGYAGNGSGCNNPDAEDQHGVGPLPRGVYTLGAPYHNEHTGRVTLNLDPLPGNEMFGRSLFRLHGDNSLLNRTASDGCIIMPLGVRLGVARRIGFEVSPGTGEVTLCTPTALNHLQVIA